MILRVKVTFSVGQRRCKATTKVAETRNDNDVATTGRHLATGVAELDVTMCLSSLDETSSATTDQL